MSAYLSDLISLYAFSTGRRLFAQGQTKTHAAKAALTSLENHCSAAIAHDQNTLVMEAKWAGTKPSRMYGPGAKKADVLIDVALGALDSALEAETRDASDGDPLGQSALELRFALFPMGLAAVTKAVYVEELAEAERILDVLQSPKWSQTVQDLGLHRRMNKLGALVGQYRTAVGAKDDKIVFEELKAMRAQGQALLHQSVAMILGLHPSDSAADVAARKQLLGPILAQNDAIRMYLKTRRSVPDVNPETGEPQGEAGQGNKATP